MKPRTKCVILTGRPGAGKSTLSRKLRETLHMPLVSRDEIKEGFVSSFGVSHGSLPGNANREVTHTFFSVVRLLLEKNVSVVAEAAFQHRLWEQVVGQWSALAQVYFVLCEVKPELAAERHLQRGLADPGREFFHGDKIGKLLPPGDYIPPSFDIPTLRVDTTNGYDPDFVAIRDFIQADPMTQPGR